ncbi:MAG TPA: lipopolysaccharide kinase InaA family protein, partial [Herpetosiphonaceae bacterium]
QSEHAILSKAHRLLAQDPSGCASAVEPLGFHLLAVKPAGFPAPLAVPCAIQAFARGIRLSEPDALPMRGAREHDGLQLLAQLAGMLLRLHQHGICHGDIKPDCLYWDSQSRMLDVIDWNTAREHIDHKDKQAEFDQLQRLAAEVFFGSPSLADSADPAFPLFGAFDGAPLSRGARLLLLRLFDPTVINRIGTLEELHGALRELLDLWEHPLSQRPEPPVGAADRWERLSKQLSAVAIEVQRDPADTLAIARRHDWARAVAHDVSREARGALAAWIEHPDRPGIVRLTDMWCWLPDIWPLMWLIPLARAWRESPAIAPTRDPQLAQLASALLQRRWDELDRQLGYAEAGAPPEIAVFLGRLRDLLAAGAELAEAQRIIAAAPPDYPRAFQRILPVEPLLRGDEQAAAVIESIAAGSLQIADIRRLAERCATLAAQAPSTQRHLERWRALSELRQNYQLTHQDYERCQALEAERAAVAPALSQLRALLAAESWQAALDRAEAISLSPEFRAELPDLAAQHDSLRERAAARLRIERQHADERILTDAAERVCAGDLLGARQRIAAAPAGQRAQAFGAALAALQRRQTAMAAGDLAAARAVRVADIPELRNAAQA